MAYVALVLGWSILMAQPASAPPPEPATRVEVTTTHTDTPAPLVIERIEPAPRPRPAQPTVVVEVYTNPQPAAPPPAPAPVVQPPPAPPPAPSPPPRPPHPTRNGAGLLAGAAVLGSVGIGGNVWRAAVLADMCARPSQIHRAGRCAFGVVELFPVSMVTWGANMTSIALAASGGATRGRHDALRYIHEGRPERSGVGATAFGTTLMSLGIASGFALRAWLISGRFFDRCEGGSTELCMRGRVYGYFAGLQGSAIATAAGAGMLAYGARYQATRGRWARHRLSVAPQMSTTAFGMQVAGRF